MSFQNVLAPRTTSGSPLGHDATPIPTPTEAPCASNGSELRRRAAESIPPNICGWFPGARGDMWTYKDPTLTCYWNSDFNIVGNALPVQTACVDGAELNSCSTCSGDVLKCSSTASYCATFLYGLSYNAYMCVTESGIRYTLQSTPDGMTGPIAFPVYTGKRGISTGIQDPSGYPIESRTIETDSLPSPSSTDSPTSTPTGPSTDSPTSTPTSSFLDPSTTPSKKASSTSAPVGAIVGGVVGGVFFIALVVGIVLFFVIRSRRNKQNNLSPPPHQPPQNGFGNPPVNPYPPIQQYYPQPNNPQPNPNQHAFPPQQLTNPELDSRLVNQQGFTQGAVSHIQPNQHTPSPQHPTAPELHSNQLNVSQGISPSELSQNQSAIPQQQPTAPELQGNQPNFGQGGSPSELYQNQPAAVLQQQPTQSELDSRPVNQAYQQVFASNRQSPQMRDNSRIHEAP
ncbi:hypothetical protein V502_04926 [Pseudogymnoascus sp. VKM F-4520 (FW-2644)]|nr:hypothetical protein V502_04926 [Pseudogymnoascus sp. VKM F-4520 (FW-2644)]